MFHQIFDCQRLAPCFLDLFMGFLRERPGGYGNLFGEFPGGKNLPWYQGGFLFIDIGANPSEGNLRPVPRGLLEPFRNILPDWCLVLVRLFTKILDEGD